MRDLPADDDAVRLEPRNMWFQDPRQVYSQRRECFARLESRPEISSLLLRLHRNQAQADTRRLLGCRLRRSNGEDQKKKVQKPCPDDRPPSPHVN